MSAIRAFGQAFWQLIQAKSIFLSVQQTNQPTLGRALYLAPRLMMESNCSWEPIFSFSLSHFRRRQVIIAAQCVWRSRQRGLCSLCWGAHRRTSLMLTFHAAHPVYQSFSLSAFDPAVHAHLALCSASCYINNKLCAKCNVF